MSKYFPLIGIFAISLILFYPAFSIYFFQDDFFHFKASITDGSLSSFVKLFGFPSFEERGYAFYRPLTREGLYNIYYFLFGLDHIPFRILSLVIHGLNILLVFLLAEKLFNKKVAYLSSLLFAISAINVGVLYYGAGGIQTAAAATFVLLSVLLFEKYFVLSILSFILALMSHEIAAVTPILLLGMLWIKHGYKNLILTAIKNLWPLGVILLPYLYLDLIQIGLKQTQVQYKPVFSLPQIANTFMWYSGWALGLPEMLIDFVNPGFKLNPNLLKYWGEYFKFIFPAFFVLLGVFSLQLFKGRKFLLDKRILFLCVWFLLCIAPVVLLPQHKFVHYLSLALVGVSILTSYLAISSKKLLSIILISSFLILNITSIKLAEKTYWAVNRGIIAGKLFADIKKQYPDLPKGAVIYIKNDPNYPYISQDWGGTSAQAKLILNDQDGLQFFYRDNSIKVIYEEDGGKVPENSYPLTAIIN